MNKNMALIGSCLLLFSTQLLANRPAMDELNAGAEMLESATPSTEPEVAEPETTKSESPISEITETEPLPPIEETSEEKAAQEEVSPTKAIAPAESIRKQTGDVLELQSGETLPVHALDFPKRGTSMDNVQKALGEPLEISPAIGDPPITTWTYNDRTIYFEHSRVIHAVSNR